MKHLEVSGRTAEEAIQSALEQLDASREEVEITVLEEANGNGLSPDSEEARVRVSLLGDTEEEDLGAIAREILESLLNLLGLDTSVSLRESPGETPVGTDAHVLLNIEGEDLGILIGRQGQTLAALQYLVRTIISHRLKLKVPLTIDVEGYRERRVESIQSLAQRLADQVAAKREPFMMQPMTAYERRIVHVELAEDPDVATHSIGIGDGRRVVIEPKSS